MFERAGKTYIWNKRKLTYARKMYIIIRERKIKPFYDDTRAIKRFKMFL